MSRMPIRCAAAREQGVRIVRFCAHTLVLAYGEVYPFDTSYEARVFAGRLLLVEIR